MSLSWRLLVVLMLVVCCWSAAEACFIRNCPRGGKRAFEGEEEGKQCMACGPGGKGQCVGPSICCGQEIGCLMGTSQALECVKENESTVPCVVNGSPCGINNMGICVANGICCVQDACSYNSICNSNQEDEKDEDDPSRGQLLTLIRRLLANRQYD
ncbi:hypothetical protein C0Q70_08740 [Pomacea canaliculata]|uniref:Uncharacterized protein n=2 Tax=Pomacea canaliculata TaxID=400727 RepID=A0A2T7P7V3_POMCA|nr:hypothetical protein C0Q70_08740 [Pomacea canaliculata]